jgi:hypothetical protein
MLRKHLNISAVGLLPILMVLLMAAPAFSVSVIKLTVPQMSNLAQSIVVGKVTEVRSEWNDAHNQIYTYITVKVDETLKGEHQDYVSLRQLGGIVDDIMADVVGFPKFKVGSEQLLFIKDNPSGFMPIVGASQGKFDILVDQETGKKTVLNNLVGTDLVSPETLGQAEAVTTMMSLDDMKASIRQTLETEQNNK